MDILIYNTIGRSWWDADSDITGETIAKQLADVPLSENRIDVRINSLGGVTSEGLAIRNQLRAFSRKRKMLNPDFTIRTIVDGYAYSAASIILLGGDEVVMNKGTLAMIHCAWTWVDGNAQQLTDVASYLSKLDTEIAGIYSAKSGKKAEAMLELMQAETFLSPQEAKNLGLIDTIDESVVANLSLHGDTYSHLAPKEFSKAFKNSLQAAAKSRDKAVPPKPVEPPDLNIIEQFERTLTLDRTSL